MDTVNLRTSLLSVSGKSESPFDVSISGANVILAKGRVRHGRDGGVCAAYSLYARGLGRITLAQGSHPMWETVLSINSLQSPQFHPVLGVASQYSMHPTRTLNGGAG